MLRSDSGVEWIFTRPSLLLGRPAARECAILLWIPRRRKSDSAAAEHPKYAAIDHLSVLRFDVGLPCPVAPAGDRDAQPSAGARNAGPSRAGLGENTRTKWTGRTLSLDGWARNYYASSVNGNKTWPLGAWTTDWPASVKPFDAHCSAAVSWLIR